MKCALISRHGFLTLKISPSYLPKVAITSKKKKMEKSATKRLFLLLIF